MLKFLDGLRSGLMMSAAGVETGGGGGALSIDQAVAALTPKEEKAPAAVPAAQPSPAAVAAEPSVEPEGEVEDHEAAADDGTDGLETEDEGEHAEVEEPKDTAALTPPKFWDAAQKELFNSLPRNVQETILKHEDLRNSATSRSMQDAAAKRKSFDEGAAKFTALAAGLEQLLPQAKETFRQRWDGVDWNAVIDQYGADQALKLKNQFELEQRQIQQLQATKDAADNIQFEKFVTEEETKLRTLVPDLVDPEKGPERRDALGKFLVSTGIEPDRIKFISAAETAIAYDAMQWRNAKAKAKTLAAQPRTPVPQRRTPAKPGATPQARSPNQRIDQLSRKRALSVDEAVELMNAKGDQQ